MDSITIYDSATLRARYVPSRDRSRLVITFQSWLTRPDRGGEGFAEAFLRKHELSAVHVRCASNAWYQYDDVAALAAATRPIRAQYGEVITYGQSMGGYAALQFIDLFRATRSLAYAPQYALDRALVPFETRWAAEAAATRLRYRGMSNWFGAEVIFFYDPRSEDRRHAELLCRDLPGAQAVEVPYAGHPATPALMEMGLLSATTLAVLRGGFSGTAFRAAYRARRSRSALYRYHLSRTGRWLPRRIALCRAALGISPGAAAAQHALAELLLQTSDLAGAEAAARQAIAADAAMPPFHRTLSVALDRAGRPAQALEVLACAIRDGAADAATHRYHGAIAERMGLLVEAEQSLRTAITLAPRAHRSHIALSRVLERLGRRAEALLLAREALAMAPLDVAYQRAVAALEGKGPQPPCLIPPTAPAAADPAPRYIAGAHAAQ